MFNKNHIGRVLVLAILLSGVNVQAEMSTALAFKPGVLIQRKLLQLGQSVLILSLGVVKR